ncbi:DUF4442 domain-containing protein [Gammaproteobacteria bacterium 45_16_T64]|nr:DUF4442 domain-containing protein [Gammaproteobacteria bacterium 45_16_T64]
MAEKNVLNRIISKLNALPESVRGHAISAVIGRTVRYAGTSNIYIEKLTTTESIMRLKNKKKVQNHIGSIHAAAMGLLAESATGLLVGMNVPDNAVPVIKTLHVDYEKRCKGDIKAVARLTKEQIEQITTTEKGEVSVDITVTDETGNEHISCEMIWAWVPKVRK